MLERVGRVIEIPLYIWLNLNSFNFLGEQIIVLALPC